MFEAGTFFLSHSLDPPRWRHWVWVGGDRKTKEGVTANRNGEYFPCSSRCSLQTPYILAPLVRMPRHPTSFFSIFALFPRYDILDSLHPGSRSCSFCFFYLGSIDFCCSHQQAKRKEVEGVVQQTWVLASISSLVTSFSEESLPNSVCEKKP